MAEPTTTSRRGRRRPALAVGLAATLVLAAAPLATAADPVTDVPAAVETAPSPNSGDSVDDMAIWVDPADPARSVVIGADHGSHTLDVYDLSGSRLHSVDASANNVDLRTGFPLAGTPVPLVGVAGSGEIAFYKLDPATRRLDNVTKGGSVKVALAHGMCLYHSARDGRFYAFAVNRGGSVTQYELVDEGEQVATRAVRTIEVDPRAPADANGNDALEGCAADDEGGSLFVGEQDWYLWRYGAEPADPSGTAGDRALVDSDVSEGGHFSRDVEGLTVVNEPGGGFLLASSQGDFTFNVYRRTAPYDFVRKVRIAKSPTADGCERTDGIDAVAADLGPAFPRGIFICQDNTNTDPAAGHMNFKFARLEHVVPLGEGPLPVPNPTTTTTTAPGPGPQPESPAPAPLGPEPEAAGRSGYWMVGNDGAVYAFGDARHLGNATPPGGAPSVDLEPTPSGEGYWVVDEAGRVQARGDAPSLGNADASTLVAGEKVTSLSATPSGNGYWLFTTRGRVLPVGDAAHLGDMSAVKLNGPVLDSVPTPSGRGYYMVASDGGIFTFGDAVFYGSTGSLRLNAPVQSLVPDPDGVGYWLVASDGGVFSFEGAFRGSMGGSKLNKPMTGMVPYGNGYLMVAEDGGIFNFSDKAFLGSLGGNPPAQPIVSVASVHD
jgi:3-phytase